jgi:hypothetical protein
MHRAAHVITDAMAGGMAPHLTDWASTGGAYFVEDARGASVAVLKPEDEEPYAVSVLRAERWSAAVYARKSACGPLSHPSPFSRQHWA